MKAIISKGLSKGVRLPVIYSYYMYKGSNLVCFKMYFYAFSNCMVIFDTKALGNIGFLCSSEVFFV